MIKNRNLVVIEPPYQPAEPGGEPQPEYTHTLENLNRYVFNGILPPIPGEEAPVATSNAS